MPVAENPVPFSHWLLALAVVGAWGTNFVISALALREVPPFMFAALRFGLASLPLLPFVRPPAAPWTRVALYGLLLGVGQFGLLFLALAGRVPPGLASLLLQAQVPFTLLLAVAVGGPWPRPAQLAALAVATAGIGVIAWESVVHAGPALTPAGVALVVAAAFCWSAASIVGRSLGRVDPVALLAWSSLVAVPPLLAMSAALDPPGTFARLAGGLSLGAWAAVAWQVIGNMLLGYGGWTWLLARHPPSTVAPVSMLVPVIGVATAAAIVREPLPAWKLAAFVLVIAGLGANAWLARAAARQG